MGACVSCAGSATRWWRGSAQYRLVVGPSATSYSRARSVPCLSPHPETRQKNALPQQANGRGRGGVHATGENRQQGTPQTGAYTWAAGPRGAFNRAGDSVAGRVWMGRRVGGRRGSRSIGCVWRRRSSDSTARGSGLQPPPIVEQCTQCYLGGCAAGRGQDVHKATGACDANYC
jgi:hypothetical protein